MNQAQTPYNLYKQPWFYKELPFLGVVFSTIVAADAWTKHWATKTFLQWSNPLDVHIYQSNHKNIFAWGQENLVTHSPFFSLDYTYVRNTGSAWGMFSSLPLGVTNVVYPILGFLVAMFLLYSMKETTKNQWGIRLGFTCILAGAFGNLLGRLTHSFVVDFLWPQWEIWGWRYSFPVFNVADAFVDVGIVIFFIANIKQGQIQQDKTDLTQ
jgi:signal peptidase II